MITLTNELFAQITHKPSLPNGNIAWYPSDLPSLEIPLRTMKLVSGPDGFVIDSIMPWWLIVSIVAGLAPKPVVFNDFKRGAVLIPCNTPADDGSRLISWKMCEERDFTLVQFSSPRTLTPEQLQEVFPPVVNKNKGVVISTNAPPWLVAVVSVAYASSVPWVANTQKDGNPVVSISNSQDKPVGSDVDGFAVFRALQTALKPSTPKRGEVWYFDDGYGIHPGIIMSPESRNAHSLDVLIVPMTSQPKHAHRHLLAPVTETGLNQESFAQYSNLSRVQKEQLTRGPMSTVSAVYMEELTRYVQSAVADVA
jgi:mRNA-degrading endonuclease toxin of MazEF toxin-antitoxin module